MQTGMDTDTQIPGTQTYHHEYNPPLLLTCLLYIFELELLNHLQAIPLVEHIHLLGQGDSRDFFCLLCTWPLRMFSFSLYMRLDNCLFVDNVFTTPRAVHCVLAISARTDKSCIEYRTMHCAFKGTLDDLLIFPASY